jgi:hypothetical protein
MWEFYFSFRKWQPAPRVPVEITKRKPLSRQQTPYNRKRPNLLVCHKLIIVLYLFYAST